MTNIFKFCGTLTLLFVGGTVCGAATEPLSFASALDGLSARSIGPTVMGTRISSIAADPRNPLIFYVGQGMGGLAKTTNGGVTFRYIFKGPVHSIGDVEVSPSNSKIVWLGTGEANDRNTSGWGDGVYRSVDAGANWVNVGLRNTKTIARIAVDPRDANVAYVAAPGELWSTNPERGLFKTTDAGNTWTKILGPTKVNSDRVGAGDVMIDPRESDVIYAALYARQRRLWRFTSGPAASEGIDEGGIFKSIDAGKTWHKLTDGLPAQTGRIGLTYFNDNPKILYAVIESYAAGARGIESGGAGGVFRSEDGGEHWTRTNNYGGFRPSYFSQIRVDPHDENRIYLLAVGVSVSDDRGANWRAFATTTHSDHHALAIDPTNRGHMILGNDGGVYQSFDNGETWDYLAKLPSGEVRNVGLDNSRPYRICLGLQDNDLWVGPSRTVSDSGILNGNWTHASYGDAGYCVFDAVDPQWVYWVRPGGPLRRVNLRTGDVANISPSPSEGQLEYRLNWNPPLIGSKHQPDVLYYGTQAVIKLTNAGERWVQISPDLTNPQQSREPGLVTPYSTLSTLVESPIKSGLLWAATDDGKVWRTKDNDHTWIDLSAGLPAEVRSRYITRIEASHADPDRAYFTVSGVYDGNYSTLVYRTIDGGKTWRSIVGDLPVREPARIIREHPGNPNVLFLGTEFGLWITLDGGVSWRRFANLPVVPVEDLAFEPRTGDLVIATQGRALYIFDQAKFIAEFTREVAAREAYLFPPLAVEPTSHITTLARGEGDGAFHGENPPLGALLTYFLKASQQHVLFDIRNAEGVLIAAFPASGPVGINRTTWDLRPSANIVGSGDATLPRLVVKPGIYTVTLTAAGVKSQQTLQVLPNTEALKLYDGFERDPKLHTQLRSRLEVNVAEEEAQD